LLALPCCCAGACGTFDRVGIALVVLVLALVVEVLAQQFDRSARDLLGIVGQPETDLVARFLVCGDELVDHRHVTAAARVEGFGNRIGQVQQGDVLRYERRGLAELLGNVTLLLALRQFAADEVGDLARGQFVALQILDDLVGLVVVVVDEGRDGVLWTSRDARTRRAPWLMR
jgi:hypothetical protein